MTLAATFTYTTCVWGSLYGDIWNFVGSVHVGETLNCKCEVKNPQNLYAVGLRKYGTMVGHVLHDYMSSHASAHYFLIRQGGVIGPLWLADRWQYRSPRLATRRSRIVSTVIYLVSSFVYLAYISNINSSYITL